MCQSATSAGPWDMVSVLGSSLSVSLWITLYVWCLRGHWCWVYHVPGDAQVWYVVSVSLRQW